VPQSAIDAPAGLSRHQRTIATPNRITNELGRWMLAAALIVIAQACGSCSARRMPQRPLCSGGTQRSYSLRSASQNIRAASSSEQFARDMGPDLRLVPFVKARLPQEMRLGKPPLHRRRPALVHMIPRPGTLLSLSSRGAHRRIASKHEHSFRWPPGRRFHLRFQRRPTRSRPSRRALSRS